MLKNTKNTIQYNKKHTHKIKTNKHYAKNNEKAHEKNTSPKIVKFYKHASCKIRTHANITGNLTEVLHLSTALLFLFTKHMNK